MVQLQEKSKNSMLIFGVIISFLFTFIPLILVAVTMNRIYTIVEVFLTIILTIVSIGAFIVAFFAVLKKSSYFFPFLYLGFNMFLSIIFSVFSFIWIFITFLEIVCIIICVKSSNNERKFIPRFRSIKALILTSIALLSLIVPILMYSFPPEFEFEVEIRPEHAGQNLEINFALANNSIMSPDLLDILNRSNKISGINISLEIPILEEFILNTTALINQTAPSRDDYVLPYTEYNNYDEYNDAIGNFERAWANFTKEIRNAIEILTLEDLYLLPESFFDTQGLIVNQTRMLADNGLAVDYMPLLEKEVYVNDKTIDRINKTLTLFKRWVEINHLEQAHRGLIFDTERDWGNDLETIISYRDHALHNEGLVKLGELVLMTKQWEYDWKNFTENYGPYSVENWDTYAISSRASYVGSATFGVHIDDLWDLDDAQQNFFKISIVTAAEDTQFDFIGIMTYETGENSEQAVYSYCRAGDYFFGEGCVPYIYSGMDHLENFKDNPFEYIEGITQKFRIAQNYGYSTVGIWGLTHLYCFSDVGSGWCGGLYDFLKAYSDPELIYLMCLNLSTPEPVRFTCNGFNFAYAHVALTLLDAYLIKIPPRYENSWPINNYSRIRPYDF